MRYQTALRPDCLLVYRIGSMRSQLAEQAVGARSEHRVKEAVEEPRQQKHGKNDQCGQHNAEAAEKEPALQCVFSRFVDTADEQRVVAAIRAPGDVEHITEHGNGPDHNFDCNVGDHTRDRNVGDASHPSCDDDDAGGDAADQVADAGNEADDAVETEANRGTRNFDEVVEHMRQEVEVFVVEGTAAAFQAGRQDLGFRGKRHQTPAASREIARRDAGAIIQVYGGYSSVAERRSVAADVVGSKPTSRPKLLQCFGRLIAQSVCPPYFLTGSPSPNVASPRG